MRYFIFVINTGYQASIAIFFVLLARQLFQWARVPKRYAVVLWILPFLRCMDFVRAESVFCLLPRNINPIPDEFLLMEQPVIYTNSKWVDEIINQSLPPANPVSSVNPIQIWMAVLFDLWVAGMVILFAYAVLSALRLKFKLRASVRESGNIYLADGIASPFVMGYFNSKIYLPSDLPEEVKKYVIRHEKQHIQAGDQRKKIFMFAFAVIYWFHPLVWAAYYCFNRDVEYACDEAVTGVESEEYRREYAKALLSLSVGKKSFQGIPLAFSEGSPKSRIKRIVDFRKPFFFMPAVGIAVALVLGVGLLTDPVGGSLMEEERFAEVEKAEDKTGEIPVTVPVVDLSASVGADGVRLYYADEQKLIFGGYFGLFVYSKPQQKVVRALDLKAIGCDATQGEDYCEILVSQFGTNVFLHPMRSDEMYEYSVSTNSLYKQEYDLDGILLYEGVGEDLQSASYSSFGEEKECKLRFESTIGSISWYDEDLIYHRVFPPEGYEDAVSFEPEDMHDLVRISMWIEGTLYETEEESVLRRVEEMLSQAVLEKGGSGCPFYDPMYLTRADGAIGVIYPATDSCDMIRTEKGYYDYGNSDNSEFWALFGDWQERIMRGILE